MQTSRAETTMLLCCARLDADPAVVHKMRELVQTGVNWDAFLYEAGRHRMLPLAYRAVRKLESHSVPAAIIDSLTSQFRHVAQRNLQMTMEMLRLIQVLEKEGIPVVPFKGPVLALSAFRDLGSRQFGDIDLLTRRADLQRARSVFMSLGYRLQLPLRESQEADYIHSEHAFRFLKDDEEIAVELHWRLHDRRLAVRLETEELWPRLKTERIWGRDILTFEAEDLLIYLCVHGAKHYWEHLEWICCLAYFIRTHSNLNWDVIIQRAEKLGVTRIVQLGLLLTSRLGVEPQSEAYLPFFKPDSITVSLAAIVWSEMFSGERLGPERELYRYTFFLKARERLSDRIRIAQRATIRIPHPESRDWKNFPVPQGCDSLYYLVRPLRMLKDHGIVTLKSVLWPNAGSDVIPLSLQKKGQDTN